MPRTSFKPSDAALRYGGAAAVGALLLALSAHAQSGQATPAASGQSSTGQASSSDSASAQSSSSDSDNTTVTIVGQKPPVQHKIDRDVYDVSKDPTAQTGSAGDVLQNVPSVSVDNQGNVSLRGNSNVKVYVNGKPSAEMEGDNRATALDAMSGGDIDSVEVITNPSAQFGADTGGGIINLVLKRNRRPGFSGNIRVSGGQDGRYNGAYSSNYTKGPMTLSLSLSQRHDVRPSTSDTDTERTDVNGNSLGDFVQHGTSTRPRDSTAGTIGLDYNLSDYDTLSLSATMSRNPQSGVSDTTTTATNASGMVTQDYDRKSVASGAQRNGSFQASLDHRGQTYGEDFKVQFRHSESESDVETRYTNTYNVPAQAATLDRTSSPSDTRIDDFSGDYLHPIGDTQQLAAGWDFTINQGSFRNFKTVAEPVGTPEVPDTTFNNDFRVKQTVAAAYATWQTQLGKWGVLAGLRVEDTDQDIDQITDQVFQHNNYVNWAPSLHLTYPLNEKTNLRLSYSHKIRRPSTKELNPFLSYQDAYDVSSGNASLKPQEIDSFEAKVSGTSWSGGVYYNQSSKTISQTARFLPGNILLTTLENAGRSQSTGAEYQITTNLTQTIAVDASFNVYYQKLDSFDPFTMQPEETKGSSYTNRGRITWSPTARDQFQIMAMFNGPRLMSQGTMTGWNMMNLNYSRVLTPKLKLIITDTDALNSSKFRTTIDNSTVHTDSFRRSEGRIFYIGLSYSFGGAKDRGNWGGHGGGPGGYGGGSYGGPGGGGPGGF